MTFFLDLVDLELVIPMVSELGFLSRMHRIFAREIINKPFILYNNNESQDNNNIDSGPTSCIMKGGQPGCDTFNMEHSLMLFIRATHEHRDGDIGIDRPLSH